MVGAAAWGAAYGMMRRMARRGGPRDSPVARQILLLQVLVVVVLVVSAVALAAVDARRDVRAESRDQALAVAESLADSPTVRTAVVGADPSRTLQPYAEEVRADTDTDFVVVMALDRTRYTHPDPDRIGERFIGDLGTAPEGRPFTQEYAGTLGPSVRAVVPVEDAGRVVALVSVGITLDRIQQQLLDDLPSIGLAALGALVVGLVGAWLISRRLRRQTHGMGEREITRMYEYYRAVLHAVREGLVLLDEAGRVQLVNDEARRLLGLPDDVVGRRFDDLGLPPAMVEAARGRVAESDHLYVLRDQVLVISSAPAYWGGAEVGAVVTVRDRTELQSVTGELDLVRGLTASLRAQNHEAANRLHTVVGLIELGRHEEAVDFATEELAVAQALADEVVGAVEEPALAALLLGKTAQAAEQGVELRLTGSVGAEVAVPSRELVTVVGNLIDNALDAVAESERRQVRLRLEDRGAGLLVEVDDSGPGVPPQDAERVLERGWSTKAVEGRGLGLALVGQVARRHGGRVEVDSSDLGGARFTVTLGPPS